MGVPNLEVGYTSATARRGDHENFVWTCGGIRKKKLPGTLWVTSGLQRNCFTFTLTSWKPLGHSRPVTGLLYLLHEIWEP